MDEFITLDVLRNVVYMLRADIEGAIWLSDDDEDACFYNRCAHPSARVLSAPGAALRLSVSQ